MPPQKLAGTIQNDILKEFMVRNTYIYPPAGSMRIIADIFAYTSAEHAEVQLDLDLRLPHAGGGRDAGPRARLHARRRRRIRPRRPRRRADHRPVRAAPVVLLGDRHELLHGGGQAARRAPALGEAGQGLRRRRATSRWRCAPTARPRAGRSPRRTSSTTSPAPASRRWRRRRAHTQSLHTNALDEALALPTDFSARIARNTQLFLQQESGTTRIIDPWGGSYYVERLTHELAQQRLGAHRRGRGARRHGEGHRGRHPEAAHRGGRGPHAGAHRLRRAGDRSASTSTARRTTRRSRS